MSVLILIIALAIAILVYAGYVGYRHRKSLGHSSDLGRLTIILALIGAVSGLFTLGLVFEQTRKATKCDTILAPVNYNGFNVLLEVKVCPEHRTGPAKIAIPGPSSGQSV